MYCSALTALRVWCGPPVQDEQLAITWLERAAAQNHAGALYNLVNGSRTSTPAAPALRLCLLHVVCPMLVLCTTEGSSAGDLITGTRGVIRVLTQTATGSGAHGRLGAHPSGRCQGV